MRAISIRFKPAHKAVRCALLATLAAALTISSPAPLEAAKTSAQKPSSKYQRVNKKLKKTKEDLKRIEQSEKVTLREIERASRKLSGVRAKHRKRKKKMDAAHEEMEAVRQEVDSMRARIQSTGKWLRRKLRAMNRYGRNGDTLLLLGSSRDLSDFMIRWRYLEKLAAHEQQAIEEYRVAIKELSLRKKALKKAYDRYRAEEELVAETAATLEARMKEKKTMLLRVKREKQTYSRIEWELKREAARIKKILSRSEREKKKVYSYKGFRKMKGKLKWPVSGRVAVPFGKHNDPSLNTPVFRNGVYISARAETVAKAVSEGKVVFADWFEGYGQLVIINHGGGYHTLYGNLSEIFLSAGDIIKRSAKVGRVGTSGIIDKPALYFEIRYKGKPLNPSRWLTN